jgi:hypothetical protein
VRYEAAGLGLHRLGPADLATIDGDRAVQRHVLRLERRHAHAATREHPAKPRDEQALARIGGRALNHQCGPLHLA